MIRGLFAGLTARPRRGQALFEAVVAEARRRHWYSEGAVPDSVESRFAMLATVAALVIVRLERQGPEGESATVALTERFIEAMDSEIREMGVGDPKVGRQVRSLVGALATRVERWRAAADGTGDWNAAVLRSVYREEQPTAEALDHSAAALRDLWRRLERAAVHEIAEGRLG